MNIRQHGNSIIFKSGFVSFGSGILAIDVRNTNLLYCGVRLNNYGLAKQQPHREKLLLKLNFLFFLTLIGFIFVMNTANIQAGDIAVKIIRKTDANSQFGPVLNSVIIPAGQGTYWLS